MLLLLALLHLPAAMQAAPLVQDQPAKSDRDKVPVSDERMQRYLQSLANAPDAVAMRLDRDGALTRIFASYDACMTTALDADKRSDLSDLSRAKIAFRNARSTCSEKRSAAKLAAVRFAGSCNCLSSSGRESAPEAIEWFVSSHGVDVLRAYYRSRGQEAEFEKIVTYGN